MVRFHSLLAHLRLTDTAATATKKRDAGERWPFFEKSYSLTNKRDPYVEMVTSEVTLESLKPPSVACCFPVGLLLFLSHLGGPFSCMALRFGLSGLVFK